MTQQIALRAIALDIKFQLVVGRQESIDAILVNLSLFWIRLIGVEARDKQVYVTWRLCDVDNRLHKFSPRSTPSVVV